MKTRIGFATDIHRLEDGKGIYLGGVFVPCLKKAVAHSDGDCLLHAIAEAIFGALAKGDLGTHFPPSDSKTEGMSSLIILKKAYEMMVEEGYVINNIDTSIVLESPKLAPYIDEIRYSIADNLKTSIDNVSVKAGTNEGIGELGENKAIQCYAVVSLVNVD